jgi:hypothetical protein
MAESAKGPGFKIKGKISRIKGKVSVVRGASVREVQSVLTDAGFNMQDIRIQGVDIDELDQNALRRVVGDDPSTLNELPIIVSGIGTKTLSTLLKRLSNARVIPGGIGDLAGTTYTLPTITITGTVALANSTITLPTITITGTPSVSELFKEPLIIEGLSRDDLVRVLASAGYNLDQIRVRPVGKGSSG